jgi:hypothetical protein
MFLALIVISDPSFILNVIIFLVTLISGPIPIRSLSECRISKRTDGIALGAFLHSLVYDSAIARMPPPSPKNNNFHSITTVYGKISYINQHTRKIVFAVENNKNDDKNDDVKNRSNTAIVSVVQSGLFGKGTKLQNTYPLLQ